MTKKASERLIGAHIAKSGQCLKGPYQDFLILFAANQFQQRRHSHPVPNLGGRLNDCLPFIRDGSGKAIQQLGKNHGSPVDQGAQDFFVRRPLIQTFGERTISRRTWQPTQ